MRRLLIVVAVFPVLALAASGAPAGVAVVSVDPQGFEPATLTIHAGDTVTWTNTGSLQHQVVSDTGAFKPSPVLQPGQSWSFTFPAQGRFAYRDALHASLTGTVVVAAAPPSVTIGSAHAAITYGGTGATLTGRVSSRRAGERVLLVARTCGQVSAGQTSVLTRRGGLWRFAAGPVRTTVYGARWGQIASQGFRLAVLPRIRLDRSGGAFVVHVRAATTFNGRTITLQRWDEADQSWAIVATAKLQPGARAGAPTIISVATLKSSSGGRVRAMLSAAQAAPCYGQSTSNVLSG